MTFDPGLQPERTHLAWRRTALSMAVGGLLALRVLPPVLGTTGVVAGIAGLAGGLLLDVAATRRSHRLGRVLRTGSGQLPDGRLLLAAAAVVSALGITATVAVALGAAGR